MENFIEEAISVHATNPMSSESTARGEQTSILQDRALHRVGT